MAAVRFLLSGFLILLIGCSAPDPGPWRGTIPKLSKKVRVRRVKLNAKELLAVVKGSRSHLPAAARSGPGQSEPAGDLFDAFLRSSDGGRRYEARTDHYRVVAHDRDLAIRAVRRLDRFLVDFSRRFGPVFRPDEARPPVPLPVFVFRSSSQLERYLRPIADPGRVGIARGLFDVRSRIIFLQAGPRIWETLRHEAGHQILAVWYGSEPLILPIWLAEGLCSYLERGPDLNMRRIEGLRGKTLPPLADVCAMDQEAFLGDGDLKRGNRHYAVAYTLFYYLLEVEKGPGREALKRCLRDVLRHPTRLHFDPTPYEPGWRTWLKKVLARS